MLKLLVSRPLPEANLNLAAAHFDASFRAETEPMTREECAEALSAFDIIIPSLGDVYDADTFAQTPRPRTKLLANFGVGFNHIDVDAARRAGIEVTNTPGAVTDATADIALMLMLMTARRAGEGERLVRRGEWLGWHPMQLLGQHVSGKSVCIIGMGRIGQAIARRCHFGFGCDIIYVNRSAKRVDFPARQVALSEGLQSADFVVLATAAGPQTQHLIGAAELAAMRGSAILVNISRGSVIDEAALVRALHNKEIAGAGLDVYEHEPTVPSALRDMDQVTLLPHLGTATLEVREQMGRMALENALAFAEGRALPNLV